MHTPSKKSPALQSLGYWELPVFFSGEVFFGPDGNGIDNFRVYLRLEDEFTVDITDRLPPLRLEEMREQALDDFC